MLFVLDKLILFCYMLDKIDYSLKIIVYMKAMYCGSFDPVTKGHLNIIKQASYQYEELIVNVGLNQDKKMMFDAETRVRLLQEAVGNIPRRRNIMVISDPGMTVDIAMKHNVRVLVRGVRCGNDDAKYENTLQEINKTLADIRGYKLMTDILSSDSASLNNVSSTMVKNLCKMKQFIAAEKCVPPHVHQELMRVYLYEEWKKFIADEQLWKVVVEAYTGRAYHNLSHLGYMFNMLQIYAEQTGNLKPESEEMRDLQLAVLLHDYVYDVSRNDNEAASAAFVDSLAQKLPEDSIARIKSLIMATTHEGKVLNEWQALICDLDLAILGTFDQDVWENYNDAIREEYAAYSEQEYLPARQKVLKSFLTRERIFKTDFFYKMFEKQARKNLMRKI